MVVQSDDRRVYERFMARFPAKYKESRNDYGTDIFLRDISADGAKIATKQKVKLNDRLDLQVDLPDGHDPMDLKGTIVWTVNTGPRTWEAGLRFDKIALMKTQRIYQFCI